MKKIGIILITIVLVSCTEQELLPPVTPVSPDGQALIVPSATVVTMEGTSEGMPRYNAPKATMPGTRGKTRAVSYPYLIANKDGKKNVIVTKDADGQIAGANYHYSWQQTPTHTDASKDNNGGLINSLSARFEVAGEDSLETVPWGETNTGCTAPWRRPTLAELLCIYGLNSQLANPLSTIIAETKSYWYAASTESTAYPGEGCHVRFDNGRSGSATKNNTICVRCVRDAYPYVTTNASGRRTVIVSQDTYGSSFAPMHAPWQQTPDHDGKDHPYNTMSPRFEFSQTHANLGQATWTSTNNGCTAPWRRPTTMELETVLALRGQIDLGDRIDYDHIWSATSNGVQAWNVNFRSAQVYSSAKSYAGAYTRCVRDLTLPLPPRPGSGLGSDGNYPFMIWAYAGMVEPTKWSTSYISVAIVKSTASGFEMYTPQYYPADGTQKLYFYASAPSCAGTAGSDTTEPIAQHSLTDGLKDVMWAKDVRGIAKNSDPTQQQQPSFLFQHVLKQVQFKVKIDETFEANKTLTKLTLKNVAQNASIKLISGTTSFSGTSDIAHTLATPVTLTTTATDACTLMFEPGATFTLEAVVDGVTHPNIGVTLTGGSNPGAAGTANVVTLTFKRAGVATNATLTSWNAVQSSDIDVDKDGTN